MHTHEKTVILGNLEWTADTLLVDNPITLGGNTWKRARKMPIKDGYRIPTLDECKLLNEQINLLDLHHLFFNLHRYCWANETAEKTDETDKLIAYQIKERELRTPSNVRLARLRLVRNVYDQL